MVVDLAERRERTSPTLCIECRQRPPAGQRPNCAGKDEEHATCASCYEWGGCPVSLCAECYRRGTVNDHNGKLNVPANAGGDLRAIELARAARVPGQILELWTTP